MSISIYFVGGEHVVLDRTTDDILEVLDNFKPGESALYGGGRKITFNPAHVTHVLDYGEEPSAPGRREPFL